jgi:hypothetical protein
MKYLEEVTTGFIIFFIIDRGSRLISTSLINREGKSPYEAHRMILQIELVILVMALLIALKVWF